MQRRNSTVAIAVALLLVASACGGATPAAPADPAAPGTVEGTIVYQDLGHDDGVEPLGDVMIVLCQVPADGLPQGPVVAPGDRAEPADVCALQAVPTALSGPDGAFTLDDVPPGTYLVMFHAWPEQMEGREADWDGVVLTEGSLHEAEMQVSASNSPDFWERGGAVVALADENAADGMSLWKGNLCSHRLGFCFSVRDGRPDPVIEVGSAETLQVELTAHFEAE